ncbi:hypothetical protein ZWY2020_027532 [Hordeum vulgare]|nr:hypothetical protein ZWY2020_027532 [Hordeum vulgare]
MAHSSERGNGNGNGRATAADLPEQVTATGKTKAKKKVRMTQAEIDSYIRPVGPKPIATVLFTHQPKVTKERLARTNLQDLGGLPVPMDQVDDYILKIIRRINKISADFLKERDEILSEYYAKGYAERELTDDEAERGGGRAPCPGRRRSRKGVAKQAGGGSRTGLPRFHLDLSGNIHGHGESKEEASHL